MKKSFLIVLIALLSATAHAKRFPGGAEWKDCNTLAMNAASFSADLRQGVSPREIQNFIYQDSRLNRREKAALLAVLGVLTDEPQFQLYTPRQYAQYVWNWCDAQ
ncbi:I-spanin [Burkholderia phage Maja]|uniref:I-spanin n=1 Tax=Burkholderia phage Maja TaxID=2767571 RepID=A0A7S6TXB9_9CAUD|nr:I-spanin [Burkholderia phage Maja]